MQSNRSLYLDDMLRTAYIPENANGHITTAASRKPALPMNARGYLNIDTGQVF